MGIAQQALLVNQAAISVVSNNIANVSTEGYSKQTVDLTPSVNYSPMSNSVLAQALSGTGVDLNSIQRASDSYLQSYYRQQNSANSYLDQYSEVAKSVENTTNELTGAKLESAFTSFYTAAQNLSSNPTDASARQSFIQSAQTIALKFNDMSTTLSNLRTSLVGDATVSGSLDDSKISLQVGEVNDKLKQLADVNDNILKTGSANSLLDKRDTIINDLSKLIPVNVTENPSGTVDLSINDVNILQGTKLLGTLSVATGTTSDPAKIQIKTDKGTLLADNINSSINSGSIGALLTAGGSDSSTLTIKGVLDNLDKLANNFSTMVNNVQTVADADGTPAAIDKTTKTLIATTAADVIFQSADGTAITAGNIKVNQTVLDDPYLIAAAKITPPINTTNNDQIGNNDNMTALLNTRTNATTPMDTTPENYVSTMVGNIGTQVEGIKTRLTNQTAVLTTVKTQLSSETGVSTDQELADLMKYQSAYQAAARVFTTCNTLLDTLVNLGK